MWVFSHVAPMRGLLVSSSLPLPRLTDAAVARAHFRLVKSQLGVPFLPRNLLQEPAGKVSPVSSWKDCCVSGVAWDARLIPDASSLIL